METKTNYWGHPVTTPLDALRSGEMYQPIRSGITRILKEFLLPNVVIEELAKQVWDVSRDCSMEGFDRRLQGLLLGRLDEAKTRHLLDLRAHHVARQIIPHLRGDSLLDVGAGDGMVTWYVRDHFKSHLLSDVIDYRDPRVSLPFEVCPEGQRLSVSDADYDTVVLTNVLHHALDPVFLLDECSRVCRGRVVIIESVYGDEDRLGQASIPFLLPVDQQFIYTSFFDWFYNRVLHSDVPVPFNYLLPQAWERHFLRRGMSVVSKQDLGIDVEIVPIHHYLYVLEKT